MEHLVQSFDIWSRYLVSLVPYDSLRQFEFFQRAVVGLLLLAPLCSTIGIQVVNFRLAFFAEAVGHSAFTGIALGFVLALVPVFQGLDPLVSMSLFGVLIALAITYYRRQTSLSSDTVIGVFSSAVIALGLCVITSLLSSNKIRGPSFLFNFLMGNILTISPSQIFLLLVFAIAALSFEFFAYNRLMFIGLNQAQAKTMGIHVQLYEYGFAVLLALVVMFSIQAIGVLLVTAMLVIPAASARNIARSAGSVFWWGMLISMTSCLGGLYLSDVYSTATGAAAVLCTTAWFAGTSVYAWVVGKQ